MAVTEQQDYPRQQEINVEKAAPEVHVTDENTSKELDTDTHKQDGVRRVEAITTVWSKKILWSMFVL
jgi:hypothetical protein